MLGGGQQHRPDIPMSHVPASAYQHSVEGTHPMEGQPTHEKTRESGHIGLFNHAGNVSPTGDNYKQLDKDQQKLMRRGPISTSGIFESIALSWPWLIFIVLILGNAFLALLQLLDTLTVGFLLPVIPLVIHIVLFVLLLFVTVWKGNDFLGERLFGDRLQIPFLAAHFTVYNLFGTLIFLIWTGAFGRIASRVSFSNSPLAYISFVSVSIGLFVWFVIIMIVWTLMCVIRYNQHKTIEILNVVTNGDISNIMTAAAVAQVHKQ